MFSTRIPTALVAGPLFLDVVMGGLDHAPVPGQEQWVPECALVPGGSANQAVALSRLGITTELVCEWGLDDAGELVGRMLGREGVGLDLAMRVPRQSVTASLAFDGDRAMTTFGSDTTPTVEGAPRPDVFLADMRALRDNIETLRRWKSDRVPAGDGVWVLADVGWDPTQEWKMSDLAPLALVDVFTPNEVEARHYTRTSDVIEAAQVLADRVPAVVITRGAAGVFAVIEGETISLPAVPAQVVDTTGAGDTFCAGLTWAHLQGLAPRAALSVASLAAAHTVGRPGGSGAAPTLEGLARWTRTLELPVAYDLSFLDLIDVGTPPRANGEEER